LLLLEPAERFVWGVLPHAARSFAPCILALPARIALPAALGYLYCRVLDTYEDLIEDRSEGYDALSQLPRRLDAIRGGADVPGISSWAFTCRDSRDEAHAMIAGEVARLDLLYAGMDSELQGIIFELVRDMSEGMRGADWAIEESGGAIRDGAQLRDYCEAVLGNPIVFAARLFTWGRGRGVGISHATERAAMDVGEFLQLANITRDMEKDLARGVCYHPELAGDMKGLGPDGGAKRLQGARCALLDRALALSPSYLKLIDGLELKSGLMSASALIMLRFTEDYYINCASRVGVGAARSSSALAMVTSAWPAIFSARWARSKMSKAVASLSALRAELPPQASSMYLS